MVVSLQRFDILQNNLLFRESSSNVMKLERFENIL